MTGWHEVIGEWYRHGCAVGYRVTTMDTRRRYLQRTVVPRIRDPWEVTTSQLDAAVREAGLTRACAIDARGAIRHFYAWAAASGRMGHDPGRAMASIGTRVVPSSDPPEPVTHRRGARRAPRRHAPEPPPAWASALAAWAQYLAAGGRSPRTTRMRAYILRLLAEQCADPWAVTPEVVLQFMAEPGLSQEGRKARRGAVSAFYRWAVAADHVAKDPAGALPRVSVAPGVPRPCPVEVFEAARRRAGESGERLMLDLGWLAGLRRAEIAGVHSQDLEGDLLRVRGKGGRVRMVPLHPSLRAALSALPPGWAFPSADGGHLSPDHVGGLIAALLGPGWGAHSLRHGAATRWYAATGDILAVSRLLGHSKPETSSIYASVPGDMLRAAVRA